MNLFSKHYKEMYMQMIFNHPEKYEGLLDSYLEYMEGVDYKKLYNQIHSSMAYRLGKLILAPFKTLKQFLKL